MSTGKVSEIMNVQNEEERKMRLDDKRQRGQKVPKLEIIVKIIGLGI